MRAILVLTVLLAAAPFQGGATEFAIDAEKSVFAVITHKAGVAAKLAHNHFIHVGKYDALLSVAENDLLKTAFELNFGVNELVVDDPVAQEKWQDAVLNAKILTERFTKIGVADREKIREHMLAAGQLDAANHPEITVKVLSVKNVSDQRADDALATHVARVALTVRGKTVERDCNVAITSRDEKLSIVASGAFTFTEFGIKPYSAFLGAVKNADEFHVFLSIEAAPVH